MIFMGAQVFAVAHGYRVVTFVPYCSVENLATLLTRCCWMFPNAVRNEFMCANFGATYGHL
jgi:hypothetical protein